VQARGVSEYPLKQPVNQAANHYMMQVLFEVGGSRDFLGHGMNAFLVGAV
jgi:hypothetical protein